MFRILLFLIPLVLVLSCAGLDKQTTPSQAPPATGATPKLMRTDDTYVVAVPGVAWALQFPAGDLLPWHTKESPGWAYYQLVHRSLVLLEMVTPGGDTKLLKEALPEEKDIIPSVSFWVDRAEKCNNDARQCRDNIWSEKKAQFPQMQDARLSQEGDMYLCEFSLALHGMPSHHMYANFVRDGIWIDFHLAKPLPYKEKDRQMFLDFLNQVRFVPISDMRERPVEVSPTSRQAFEQFRARAEKGEAFAQMVMGTGYLLGSKSTARDHVAARFWFRKAADQGDIHAQRLLGMMLEQGWGGPQDYPEALMWYRKAAEQGNAVAQSSLGTMYAEGRGVPKDSVRAYLWISVAAPSLPDDAKKEANDTLAKLAKGMTPEQLEQAQAMAQACRPARYQHCDQ